MKLTSDEYLLILERRGDLQLSPEEEEYIKTLRLKKREPWSTYLFYIKDLVNSGNQEISRTASAVIELGKKLKIGDIEFLEFKNQVKSLKLSISPQLAYMVDQMIANYKEKTVEDDFSDLHVNTEL